MNAIYQEGERTNTFFFLRFQKNSFKSVFSSLISLETITLMHFSVHILSTYWLKSHVDRLCVLLTQLSRYLSLGCSLFLIRKYFFLILQPEKQAECSETLTALKEDYSRLTMWLLTQSSFYKQDADFISSSTNICWIIEKHKQWFGCFGSKWSGCLF